MAPVLVMMEGPAGSGKSTLADGIAAEIGADRISENDLFRREEFTDVGRAFKTRAWPTTDMMLASYRRLFAHNRSLVFDWSAAGMIEDLPCAQPDGISLTTNKPHMHADPAILSGHTRDVRQPAAGFVSVLFVLDVRIPVAVDRRMRERGASWFDTYLMHEPACGEDDTVTERMIRWFEAGRPRHLDCVNAHEAGGWFVARIDAAKGKGEVLRQALDALGRAGKASNRRLAPTRPGSRPGR